VDYQKAFDRIFPEKLLKHYVKGRNSRLRKEINKIMQLSKWVMENLEGSVLVAETNKDI